MASILEYEANRSKDYPKVARVLYNRLEQGHAAAAGLDGGLRQPAFGRRVDDRGGAGQHLGVQHLRATPVCRPDRSGPRRGDHQGALSPAKGDWLYFVPDYEDDTTRFSETLKEHHKWVDKLRAYCRKSEDC